MFALLLLSFSSIGVAQQKPFKDFPQVRSVLTGLGCFDTAANCPLRDINDNCEFNTTLILCDDSGEVIQLAIFDAKLKGRLDAVTPLKKLQFLSLSNNSLMGELTSLMLLTELQYANLAANKIEGSIPQSITALTSLWGFFVQGNNITGMVPVLGPQLGDNCVIESATFPGNCVDVKMGGCNGTCVCDPAGAVCGGTTVAATLSPASKTTQAPQSLPPTQTTAGGTAMMSKTTTDVDEKMPSTTVKSVNIESSNKSSMSLPLYIIIAVLGVLLLISVGVIGACNVKLQRLQKNNVEQGYAEVINSSSSSSNNQNKPSTKEKPSNIYDVVSEVSRPLQYDLAPMPSQPPVYGQSSLSAIRLTPEDEVNKK